MKKMMFILLLTCTNIMATGDGQRSNNFVNPSFGQIFGSCKGFKNPNAFRYCLDNESNLSRAKMRTCSKAKFYQQYTCISSSLSADLLSECLKFDTSGTYLSCLDIAKESSLNKSEIKKCHENFDIVPVQLLCLEVQPTIEEITQCKRRRYTGEVITCLQSLRN